MQHMIPIPAVPHDHTPVRTTPEFTDATTITIDVTAWTTAPTSGGLIERWNAASRSGDVTSRGFYSSELNRLERVSAAIAAGNLTMARSELDTFIAHLEDRAPKPITDAAAAELAAYARAVRAAL